MLQGFICPDGEHIDCEQCLTQCRMGKRCLTKPTIVAIVMGVRPWDGIPHVTSLMNGLLEEFLKIKHPYYVVPESRAFALLGSAHHVLLEKSVFHSELVTEPLLRCSFMQGTPDLYDSKECILYDYKTWGSYRMVKILGLKKQPNKTFAATEEPDLREITLQMNAYRYMLNLKNIPVKEMYAQVIVRDGGLQVATQRGVTNRTYVIDVPIISDEEVVDFFQPRAEQLVAAVNNPDNFSIPVCSQEERWYGNKCKGYCDVENVCQAKYLWEGEQK